MMRLIPKNPKSQSLQKVQNSMRGLLYPRAVCFATFAKNAPFRTEASQDESPRSFDDEERQFQKIRKKPIFLRWSVLLYKRYIVLA